MSDLIEKAMEAFNALSSEQQAEMLEETRKSFAENNVALSRPAAPVEGLEEIVTKAMQNEWEEICADTDCHPLDIEQLGRRRLRFSPNHWASAVAASVRSQAEAIFADLNAAIAVKDHGLDVLEKRAAQLQVWLNELRHKVQPLEANNAALTARVKKLADERYKLAYAITGGEDAPGYLDSLSVETLVEVARDNARRWFVETDRTEALETQLAAAEEENRKLKHDLAIFHKDNVAFEARAGLEVSKP